MAQAAAAHLDFIRRPTARNWYRAHNVSIVEGYLANADLAPAERRVERFFMNVVLVRVLSPTRWWPHRGWPWVGSPRSPDRSVIHGSG